MTIENNIGYSKPMNKVQTPFTEALKEELPTEVWENMLDIIAKIKFIQNLIAPEEERGYAKDKEKEIYDDKGNTRLVINDKTFTNPHILEDMDFFRERAIFFLKHGKYFNYPKSRNPHSEYRKHWSREMYRWVHGMVRPSDGEWIPGYYYFYLNYSPIMINIISKTYKKNISKKKGVKKKGDRIESFPEPWLGDYLWFHYFQKAIDEGKHGSLLKTRGIGASYKKSLIGPLNMLIFKKTPNFYIAGDSTFLEGADGIFVKVTKNLDFVATHTPFAKLRLIDKSELIKFGYTNEYGVEQGLLSSVSAISVANNPDKARGVRGKFILYEEAGTIKDVEQIWGVNRRSLEEGDIVFGIQVAIGTGGSKKMKFVGLKKLYYKPDSYNIFSIPNVYDSGADGSLRCGFFWGSYMNLKPHYDKNGNPDVIGALITILLERNKVKYSSDDTKSLAQLISENCITPKEATLQVDTKIFPVAELKEAREKLLLTADYAAKHYIGELKAAGHTYRFVPTSGKPIRDFPVDMKNGVVPPVLEMFSMPTYKGLELKPARGRYIATLDPYKVDAEETDSVSLGSFIVLDLLLDTIVAEYTGREVFADDFFENCVKIARFYNCQILYENNISTFYSYMKNTNLLYMLMDRPEILIEKELLKGKSIGSGAKGIPSTAGVKEFGITLYRDWLLSPSYSQPEDADETTPIRKNLEDIRSPALLEETLMWNPDGNFDRVSAMIVLMIARAELRSRFIKSENTNEDEDIDADYITNSKFVKGFLDNRRVYKDLSI